MKKYLFFSLLTISSLIYGQDLPRIYQGIIPNDKKGDNLYITGGKINKSIDSLNAILNLIHHGIFKLNALQIGGNIKAILDSATNDGSGLKFYSNGSPVPIYIPSGNTMSISAIKSIPKFVNSSGDTSVYPIPERGGIFYNDSTGNHLYFSKKQGRGNWIKIY